MFACSARIARKTLAPVTTMTAISFLSTSERSAVSSASNKLVQQSSKALQNYTQNYYSTVTAASKPKSVVFPSPNLIKPNASTTTVSASRNLATTPQQTPVYNADVVKSNKTFLAWYEGHLQARPVFTKMCTGCTLWGLGDAVAQVVPHYAYENNQPFTYDWMRTGRASLFGFALHAPTSHLHFNFLEWMTVKAGFTGIKVPLFKAFMEQFVYWSWVSNCMYHGAMGLMQGMNFNQIYHRIEDVLWDTQKAQWAFWIPVQLLNFSYVPLRHQLNVVLITSIAWTALLSIWYPPIKDETKEEKDKRLDIEEAAAHD